MGDGGVANMVSIKESSVDQCFKLFLFGFFFFFFFSEIMSLFKTIINSFYILSFPPSVCLCGYTEMEMHLFIKT